MQAQPHSWFRSWHGGREILQNPAPAMELPACRKLWRLAEPSGSPGNYWHQSPVQKLQHLPANHAAFVLLEFLLPACHICRYCFNLNNTEISC